LEKSLTPPNLGGAHPMQKFMEVKKMVEIEDKLNINYLWAFFDFIKLGPKYIDIERIVETVDCFKSPEKLEQLKWILFNLNRKYRSLSKAKFRYKFNSARRIGKIFKRNQEKGQRKGSWYNSLLLIQEWIENEEKEKAIEFAKDQVIWLKERRPATYYRRKKDLKEIGIEIL